MDLDLRFAIEVCKIDVIYNLKKIILFRLRHIL